MKFQKTLNLWGGTLQDDLLSGRVVLQRGQWLICGSDNSKRCRYVGHTGRSINVVHWQGTAARTNAAFMARCESERLAKIYEVEGVEAWRAAVELNRTNYKGI